MVHSPDSSSSSENYKTKSGIEIAIQNNQRPRGMMVDKEEIDEADDDDVGTLVDDDIDDESDGMDDNETVPTICKPTLPAANVNKYSVNSMVKYLVDGSHEGQTGKIVTVDTSVHPHIYTISLLGLFNTTLSTTEENLRLIFHATVEESNVNSSSSSSSSNPNNKKRKISDEENSTLIVDKATVPVPVLAVSVLPTDKDVEASAEVDEAEAHVFILGRLKYSCDNSVKHSTAEQARFDHYMSLREIDYADRERRVQIIKGIYARRNGTVLSALGCGNYLVAITDGVRKRSLHLKYRDDFVWNDIEK